MCTGNLIHRSGDEVVGEDFDWPLSTTVESSSEHDFPLYLPEVLHDLVGGVPNTDGKPEYVDGAYFYPPHQLGWKLCMKFISSKKS
jgi:hypothetical protein